MSEGGPQQLPPCTAAWPLPRDVTPNSGSAQGPAQHLRAGVAFPAPGLYHFGHFVPQRSSMRPWAST